MRITGGIKEQPAGYHFSTAYYDQFQVILVTSGVVGMLVHKEVIPMTPGMVIFLPAESAFSLSCEKSDGYRGVFAICTEATTNELAEVAGSAWTGTARILQSSSALRQLGELLEAEALNPGQRTRELFEQLCLAFLNMGIRLAAEQGDDDPQIETAEYWVDRAMRMLESSVYTNQTAQETVSGLGLSYRQLSRHFQALKGFTPKQYQLRCRIQEAKRLLSGTRLPITAIALDLGFSSSQHFATAFRNLESCTPGQYRQRRTS